MSHGKIREDKTCLNCGHHVEERFCPHCGQENIESKQPFHFLFTHFIEDFTHYDGQFWKTIQYLFTRPGKLTQEYLAGKRQIYVAPVKLYIFISFITFFLPSLFSHSKTEDNTPNRDNTLQVIKEKKETPKEIAQITDTLKKRITLHKEDINLPKEDESIKLNDIKDDSDTSLIDKASNGKLIILGAKNMEQFDSISHVKKDIAYAYIRPFAKKLFHLQDSGLSHDEISKRFTETLVHTLPKALFVYLPVFAFFLWVFHNKKRWWFFDHGIFTLHYFSFLLLSTLILIFLPKIRSLLPDNGIITFVMILLYAAVLVYMSVYFFVAHHRVYDTKKSTSILKGMALFIVNSIGILIMFLILLYVSFWMMH
ncbi:DUF3667 domain-containing protein [Chryseobacterium sp. PMSZPI]|uniref:DUF3667 domain-containing protein n=1 Tax=Chryseobacterium sp. PMSZPI TaxID=1033900 RepID=UPI000C33439C|nr:DUF3667 domain-containing protein [Chryseobacterium sp. PMSZPI]PKF74713.1 hypothetical protein CW752_07830 [Chryseobacterium sp. PMSZPI]